MIKTIIIEDEPAAQKELASLLNTQEDIRIIATAATFEQSISLLRTEKADLVFMDISLYDCSAFDILNQLETLPEHIIFVTAFDQYAIKAIKFGALDYLLKPIDEKELQDTLQRYRNLKKTNISAEQLALSNSTLQSELPKKIALSSLGEFDIVPFTDIKYCQGDGPYTHFFLTNEKKKTTSKPLKYYESLLPEFQFIRTHQSYLINRIYIKSIQYSSIIVLTTGEEIPISLRRKSEVLKSLTSNI